MRIQAGDSGRDKGGIARFRHGHELASHWWDGMFLEGGSWWDRAGSSETPGHGHRGPAGMCGGEIREFRDMPGGWLRRMERILEK